MQGTPGVLERLTAAVVAETRSALQYEIHAALLDNWGLAKLAEHERGEAEEERGHRRRFMDRITLMGGDLDVGAIGSPRVGASVPELLTADLALEREAVAAYSEAAVYCRAGAGDLVSAALFESILADEEGHVNWLETQLAAIDQFGLSLYLSRAFKV